MTNHPTRARIRVAGLQPAQLLAGLVGLAFIAAGIVGFTRTGVTNWAADNDTTVLGFMVNPLHNLVHLVIGLLGVLMALGAASARTYGWLLFLGYGVVFLWGLAITGVFSSNPVSGLGNPLHLNTADNWLHAVSAVIGLLIAILPARKKVVPEVGTAADAAPEHHIPPQPVVERERTDHRVAADERVDEPIDGRVHDGGDHRVEHRTEHVADRRDELPKATPVQQDRL